MSFNDEYTAETNQEISTSTPIKWKKVFNQPSGDHEYGVRGVAIKDSLFFFSGKYLFGNNIMIYDTNIQKWLVREILGFQPEGVKDYDMVVENTRILLFGGINKSGVHSNTLYELETSYWRWNVLNPRPASKNTLPCPRICHSFTIIGNKVYLYGGRNKGPRNNETYYLNDLFTLDISSPNALVWDKPETVGDSPPALSSHTAVSYTNSKGKSKLIIFGGENALVISGNIYTLDIETMSWDTIILNLNPSLFLPRYLHTAVTIKNRMFVFGGWVPLMNELPIRKSTLIKSCESTNELLCLNLETMSFEELNIDMNEGNIPKGIAGHCAVAMQTKMYVWFSDLWYLEVNKPQKCSKIDIFRTSFGTLETRWNREPTADTYILQIQEHKSPANTTNPVPSSMIDYSSLPFLTSELAKLIIDPDDDDNDDCKITSVISKNVNSETVQASENMKINTVQNTNITPETPEFIGSHSMDMADPNTITAATSDTQINTVQNTNITPETPEFIGSHSMDMADPNTITAATSDTQINKTTVNSTQTKFPKPRLSRTQSI